jgi:hypothetical protein
LRSSRDADPFYEDDELTSWLAGQFEVSLQAMASAWAAWASSNDPANPSRDRLRVIVPKAGRLLPGTHFLE